MLWQTQRFDDFGVIFAGHGAHHAAGGGVGVFVGFDAAEAIQQIFRHQQEIGGLLQPPGQLVRVQLIKGVEGLELNARSAV